VYFNKHMSCLIHDNTYRMYNTGHSMLGGDFGCKNFCYEYCINRNALSVSGVG